MSATPESSESRPRVLIVDDSRIVRATIIKHVKGRYDFREEADGEAGWAALLVDPTIQVVISDIGMPQLDGYGFLERLRASNVARIREMPFVIISGEEDEASRAKAKELGATDFITKGIGTAELLARLDSLVKLAKTQDALEASRENQIEAPESGLNSRRVIQMQAAQALSHASRHGLAASLLVMGLDGLDALRAKYGEAAIDNLVKRFGQMLAAKIRREDSLGDLGDSSFAVVSPSTDEHGAQIFATRLRDAVEQANVGFQGQRIALTVSIGIACCPPDVIAGPVEFLDMAIARMRQGAQAGGHRIIGCGGRPASVRRTPKLEEVVAMLRGGNEDGVRGHVGHLMLGLLPLLRLADRECALGLPLEKIEASLRERARSEEDAQP